MIDKTELERRKKLWEAGYWEIPDNLDTSNFNFNWRPYEYDRPYIHQFGTQWQEIGGPRFIVPEDEGVKYQSDQHAIVIGVMQNWNVLIPIDDSFDFKWSPHPYEPPLIYVWGNQWNDAVTEPTVEYRMPGAIDRKYMTDMIATVTSTTDNWKVLIEGATIDQSWRPNPYEPPLIYVWGNQWNDAITEPTIEYHVAGATDRKYMTDMTAIVTSTTENWKVLIEGASIDQSWRPNPYDPPYIYVFGNKWNDSTIESTVEYHVAGATDKKYITDIIADLIPTIEQWKVLIEGASVDFTWRPSPYDPPLIYVFGNKWNDSATEPTIEYHSDNATDKKYMTDIVANLIPTIEKWTVSDSDYHDIFDFSWRPNPFSPPQIYQWENNGPVYTEDNATEIVLVSNEDSRHSYIDKVSKYYITTTLNDLIEQHPNEVFWALNSELNYNKFDFDWSPNLENFRHTNVFGTSLSKDVSTYYVNGPMWAKGFREFNYVDYELDIVTDIDIFYIDRGNNTDQHSELLLKFPKLHKTRYANSWIDTINRCIKKSTTKLIWVLSSDVDYSDFKFDFYPSEWQRKMIHIFGTQWSHWGNTYMINTETFETDTKYLEKIEHAKNINFVRRRRAKISQCLNDIVYIDFGNKSDSLSQLKSKYADREITVIDYNLSYVNTLTQWVNDKSDYEIKQEHNVWVCSSICDYENFDFTWDRDPYQFSQIHVFSSKFDKSKQKFGDTFFINLREFKKESENLIKLENYSASVNYIGHISVPRLQHPIIYHDHDSQASAINDISNRNWPYYELIVKHVVANKHSVVPNMWDSSEHQVITTSTGSSRIFVPDVAIDVIHSEVYEYPNLTMSDPLDISNPIDIVFISNGEPSADSNYERLLEIAAANKLSNRIVRVKDVVGRVASQHAAANASETQWYFLINGKLEVNSEFDFNWQPDRLQRAKHYIFKATNPVNDLEYGHQAIVANNRTLTLDTIVQGLDFTLDSPHETVDLNCGIARFNTDAWTTWRTAFREVIKLSHNTDEASIDRLKAWLTIGNETNGEWSIKGAQDAVAYYDSVNGKLTELMKSYDWKWLEKLYKKRYC